MDLRRRLSPNRIVTLIEPQNAESAVVLEDFGVGVDCFRSFDDSDWQGAVRALMDVVPIIILDAQGMTSAVVEECEYICSNGFGYKTILLGEANCGRRSLDMPLMGRWSRVKRHFVPVEEHELFLVLDVIMNSHANLPSRSQPITKVIRDTRH